MSEPQDLLSLVDRVHHLFAVALPENFSLFVGQPPGGDLPAEYAAVMYGGEDRPDATARSQPAQWGNRTDFFSEEIEIWCCISTASREQDGRAQAQVTQNYLKAVRDEVKKDPTLGGTIDAGGFATIGSHEWLIDNGGQIATVFFQVLITLNMVE